MTDGKRYTLIDIFRGLFIISMVVYHAVWDIVYIYAVDLGWYSSSVVQLWQASIRYGFILLSGFCWSMSRNKLKRALIVLAASVIISLVTAVFMPENRILFGVLSLIGTGMLVTVPLERAFEKISPYMGLAAAFLLFWFTIDAGLGTFGFGGFEIIKLPDALFANNITAYLGFPHDSFTSPDYVPVIPWLFIYWAGYFLYRIFERHNFLRFFAVLKFRPLEFLGRHSLLIYMLHQPVVYAGLYLWFKVI